MFTSEEDVVVGEQHHHLPAGESAAAGAHGAPGHGSNGAHDKHEGHRPEMFRDRLGVSLILTVPILYLSTQFQNWFGYDAVEFPGDGLVSPLLATVLFVYAGSVFLQGGWREVRSRQPGMMVLISIAISVAYFFSLAVSLGFDGEPFYWELATLLDVMLLGHWIEMRSVQAASRALAHLAEMLPTVAHRLNDRGELEDVAVAGLSVGDTVVIKPGEQVPADGEVAEGTTTMNEAFLTGESRPAPKQQGDEVIAGAVNGEGVLQVRVTRTGNATTLSQIMRLVEEAQVSRSRFQALADRAAYFLTLVAVGVSVPTLVAWAIFGTSGITFAVTRAVTVLVIACPHALGLAIPLVNVNATSISASNGILVRNREAFERGRAIAIVAFDKTGTLTEGEFVVTDVATQGMERSDALRLAASLERSSEHPLATAIVEAAPDALYDVTSLRAIAGQGIEGIVEDRVLRIGRAEWAAELGVEMPSDLAAALVASDHRGESAVVLMDDGTAAAVFSLGDRVREQARGTVRRLGESGVEVVMITGDAEAVAAAVAEELAIGRFHARVLPQDKARIVEELKGEGPTAFVGDGINDAPALLAADLGIAIGAGTNVAIESADLVLVENNPADVLRALTLSRATHRKMVQNLAWATGYNAVAIPLAAGVAASAGILLSPAIGALFMSLSTVIVAINAMLLRRIDLSGA